MIDFANDKLGALWEKQSKKGTPMLTGKIGEQAVVCFKSKSDNPNAPTWSVFKSEPLEPKHKTDEMPF